MNDIDNLIKEMSENISGIWVNDEYDLLLGLPPSGVFSFADDNGWYMAGKYSIVLPQNSPYISLRLVDNESGETRDYVIREIKVFDTLIISHGEEILHFKNVLPDEYDGEVFNPADN